MRDEFEETVEMSTYLVAFVVCDFTSVSKLTKKNVNVSVIATPDKIDQVSNHSQLSREKSPGKLAPDNSCTGVSRVTRALPHLVDREQSS